VEQVSDFLVTIDREEWQGLRQREVLRKEWWALTLRRFEWLSGVGRTLFKASLETGVVTPLFEVPQRVDPAVMEELLPKLATWGKALSRGMRSIWVDGDGNWVVSDVFGIYRMDPTGQIRQYLSLPEFADIHCAYPGRDADHLLVTCTGTEELVEVRWDGTVVETIPMGAVFGTGTNTALAPRLARNPDRRRLPLDHSKHIYHVNWAQYLPGGRILVSCHTPGLVAVLERRDGEGWVPQWHRGYFPHCHCPVLDEAAGEFYVCVSRTDEVRAVRVDDGRTLWAAPGISYGKAVALNGPNRVVAGDCNGKRLVELDRATGAMVREVALPGIPYGICALPGGVARS